MEGYLTGLPKAHLHLHLTGSMRPATLRELAARYRVAIDESSPAARDWHSFQRRYDAARSCIRTVEDVHRVILEAAQDDVADGSVWLELQASPTGIGRQLGLVEPERAIEVLLEGCERATASTGLGIGLIVAASWTRPPEEAERIAAAAGRYAGWGVVGFGISDDERNTDPARWRTAARLARDQGLLVTPHSGFYTGPDHIRACLTELGANRIGHGITAVRDDALMAMLASAGTTIELCPTSYPPFGVVGGLKAVPLKQFRGRGVPVALGADDPLLFGAGLADQYRIARDVLGLDDVELADLARESVRASAAT